MLDLIDTLWNGAFQANEALRLVQEQAEAAGCRFTPLHMHRLERENLDFWIATTRREAGLPPED